MGKEGNYARANQRFHEEYLPFLGGKSFTSEDVYNHFLLHKYPTEQAQALKHAFANVLWHLSQKNKERELEQTGKRYRLIDRNLKIINWWDAKQGDILNIRWPRGVEDQTSFGFDDSVKIYPGDLIVLAGEGNKGKTTFALNLMIENMDAYPCFYFTSEFNAPKFIDRINSFDWVNLYKQDGTPKFTVIEHPDNWQDVIQPDAINIIDWIKLEDDLWKIRGLLELIIKNLRRGIVLAVLQKRSYKMVGEGGEGTMDLSSVYLTIRFDEKIHSSILKVNKVKSPVPGIPDPNYKQFRFRIIQNGAKFHDIEEIK